MRLALLAVSVCSAAKASFVPTAELPDLLTSNDGSPVKTAAQWSQRRDELKVLLQDHILGTLPTGTPALLRATAINTTVGKRGISSCYARLAFRANATTVEFDIELAWPTSATEPLPLVLTQWNHRSWAMQGVQRGYMMVLYPGADTRDASGAFRAAYPEASMRKIMARAFVASRTLDALLVKDGSAVLGAKLPAIDASRVTITGHSRNGKQSLIAAAFDERITAVVGSSPGTPVSAPVRFSSPDFNGETTKYVTDARDWWLPSLHSYLGREHELPADGHMILALVAPRHAMLATARSDGEGDVSFADEQNILANRPVWKLLTGSEDGIRIKWREGRHHGFDDPQTYFDWFDFAGSKTPPDLFATTAEEELPHAFNWSAWRAATASSTPPPPPASAPLAERVNWMLGSGAETATTGLGGFGYCESGAIGSEWDYKAKLMMHDSFRSCRMPSSPLDVELSTKEDPPPITTAQQRVVADDRSRSRACPHNVTRISLSFGAYITASLFVPCATARCEELEGKPPIPTVIFLHGYSYQLGFTGIYGLYESETDGGLINALVGQQGVAVLAWDLTGHGARQTEGAASFYRRYKHASRLGAMVGEVQSAMDFIHCSPPEAFNTLPECSDGEFFTGPYKQLAVPALDENKTFLLGYSMGAIVALHAASLIPQVAGVAAFGGWSPFEAGRDPNSAENLATGGNSMIAETHALLPRLGIFSENSDDLHGVPPRGTDGVTSASAALPYDYTELIGSIAPRPTLLYTPKGNRFAQPVAVAKAAQAASERWGSNSSSPSSHKKKNFVVIAPNASSDFASAEISAALSWTKEFVVGSGGS